jgi:hypothetical protein
MALGQKIDLAQSMTRFTARRVSEFEQLLGKSLPCSVVSVVSSMIVTVKLEIQSVFTVPNITVPVAGTEYDRLPIQQGCKGFLIPADAQLGAMSGLGSGVADLTTPANLSACVFVPFGNTGFFSVDPNYRVIYGPDGTIIRSPTQANQNLTLVNGTSWTMQFGSNSIVVDAAGIHLNGPLFANGVVSGATAGAAVNFGAANVTTTGTVTASDATINGKLFSTHVHKGVTTGSSDTGIVGP